MPYSSVQAPLASVVTSNTTVNGTALFRPRESSVKAMKIKIEAATGTSVVFLLMLVIIGWCIYRKKSQLKNSPKTNIMYDLRSPVSGTLEYGGKPEVDGKATTMSELDHDPESKLMHQLALMRQYELRKLLKQSLTIRDL